MQLKSEEKPKALFLPYIEYWEQMESLHQKKGVAKSEAAVKSKENNCEELKCPFCMEPKKKTLQFREGYVQISQNHGGDGKGKCGMTTHRSLSASSRGHMGNQFKHSQIVHGWW